MLYLSHRRARLKTSMRSGVRVSLREEKTVTLLAKAAKNPDGGPPDHLRQVIRRLRSWEGGTGP